MSPPLTSHAKVRSACYASHTWEAKLEFEFGHKMKVSHHAKDFSKYLGKQVDLSTLYSWEYDKVLW